jgi:predicted molibdopterin-dependent oxidoreductase YjgC
MSTSPSKCTSRVAEDLGRIKAEHGPDAIACLASSRATNEDCYVMQRLMRGAIGTHNIDNCSRVPRPRRGRCASPLEGGCSFAIRALRQCRARAAPPG